MPEGSARSTPDEGASEGRDTRAPRLIAPGPWREELARQALAAGLSDGSTASAAADATVVALQLLFVELEPLLGHRAMRALYGRGLYLARSSFFQPMASPDNGQHFLDPLHADLASKSPKDARRTGETLLLTFSDLLVSFLGEPIARRVLRSAWGETATTRDKPT